MRAILEVVLSVLAVVGLVSLSWVLFGCAAAPAGGEKCCILVPGRGDAEELEQAVKGLEWLRCSGLLAGDVMIVDCGLSETGRAVAAALCLHEPGIGICGSGELPKWVEQKSEK